MVPQTQTDVEQAKLWLETHCNHGHVGHVLERALEYFEAIERAGLCTQATEGDDLYSFLSDPAVQDARGQSFVQATL